MSKLNLSNDQVSGLASSKNDDTSDKPLKRVNDLSKDDFKKIASLTGRTPSLRSVASTREIATQTTITQIVEKGILSQEQAEALGEEALQHILKMQKIPLSLSKTAPDLLEILFRYEEVFPLLETMFDKLVLYYNNQGELKLLALISTLHKYENAGSILSNSLLNEEMLIKVANATNGDRVLKNIYVARKAFKEIDLNRLGDLTLALIFKSKEQAQAIAPYIDLVKSANKMKDNKVLATLIQALAEVEELGSLLQEDVLTIEQGVRLYQTDNGSEIIKNISRAVEQKIKFDFSELDDAVIARLFSDESNLEILKAYKKLLLEAAKQDIESLEKLIHGLKKSPFVGELIRKNILELDQALRIVNVQDGEEVIKRIKDSYGQGMLQGVDLKKLKDIETLQLFGTDKNTKSFLSDPEKILDLAQKGFDLGVKVVSAVEEIDNKTGGHLKKETKECCIII